MRAYACALLLVLLVASVAHVAKRPAGLISQWNIRLQGWATAAAGGHPLTSSAAPTIASDAAGAAVLLGFDTLPMNGGGYESMPTSTSYGGLFWGTLGEYFTSLYIINPASDATWPGLAAGTTSAPHCLITNDAGRAYFLRAAEPGATFDLARLSLTALDGAEAVATLEGWRGGALVATVAVDITSTHATTAELGPGLAGVDEVRFSATRGRAECGSQTYATCGVRLVIDDVLIVPHAAPAAAGPTAAADAPTAAAAAAAAAHKRQAKAGAHARLAVPHATVLDFDTFATRGQLRFLPQAASYGGLTWGVVDGPGVGGGGGGVDEGGADSHLAVVPGDFASAAAYGLVGLAAGTTSAPNALMTNVGGFQYYMRSPTADDDDGGAADAADGIQMGVIGGGGAKRKAFDLLQLSVAPLQAASATLTLEGWRAGVLIATHVADVSLLGPGGEAAVATTIRPSGFVGLDEVRMSATRGVAACGSLAYMNCGASFVMDDITIVWRSLGGEGSAA